MAHEPTARLSFRDSPEGGGVRTDPSDAEYRQLTLRRRLVLLIHGYNNDLKDSEDAYRGFETLQRELGGLDDDTPVAGGRLVEVYWPGDADWGKLASALFYPFSIGRAQISAAALATVLARAARESGHKQVDIVAHSMGCRLTLELLKQLRNRGDITVGRVVLMAGAVPTFLLDPRHDRQKLRAAYDSVLSEDGLSLYSADDKVLAYAFPLGQTMVPGEGFFPTALGHGFWADAAAPINLTQTENTGADHSDYWGWDREPKPLACARAANAQIKDFLRFECAGERTSIQRETFGRSVTDARVAGTARARGTQDLSGVV
ncbi:MAG: alpha/beta hydrolase [Sulfuricaulis sp.]